MNSCFSDSSFTGNRYGVTTYLFHQAEIRLFCCFQLLILCLMIAILCIMIRNNDKGHEEGILCLHFTWAIFYIIKF